MIHTDVSRWLHRIQAEYDEMPGLNLTKAQMQRLFDLEASLCDAVLDTLVAARVLRESVAGTYVARGSAR
jgi:hypothetical protein